MPFGIFQFPPPQRLSETIQSDVGGPSNMESADPGRRAQYKFYYVASKKCPWKPPQTKIQNPKSEIQNPKSKKSKIRNPTIFLEISYVTPYPEFHN